MRFGPTHRAQKRNGPYRHQRDNQQRHDGIKHIRNSVDENRQTLAFGRHTILLQQAGEISAPTR